MEDVKLQHFFGKRKFIFQYTTRRSTQVILIRDARQGQCDRRGTAEKKEASNSKFARTGRRNFRSQIQHLKNRIWRGKFH